MSEDEEDDLKPPARFMRALYNYFPALVQFDELTGNRALFKESLEALQRQLPKSLKEEPLVVGSYLMKIMSSPDAAGLIIAQAWQLGFGTTTGRKSWR